jgi:hypothetical protein
MDKVIVFLVSIFLTTAFQRCKTDNHVVFAVRKVLQLHKSWLSSLCADEIVELAGNDKPSHRSGRQSRENTSNKSRESQARHISTARRGKLSEDTDLNTERADVSETAASVGSDEAGTGRKLTGQCQFPELAESNVLVGNDLLRDQSGNLEEVAVLTRDTEQECDGVEQVAEDGLEGELRVVDVKVTSPPSHQTVDEADGGKDTEDGGDDAASDLQTEPGAVGEGVQGILSLVLVIVGNDDASGRQGLFGLGVSKLGHGKGSRDRHDARRDENLGVQAKANVTDQDGPRDGSETAGHDLVELSLGHVRHERADQHGRLSLADEGRRGGDNGLGTRDTQHPEDEGSELEDEPLKEANVVENLDQGDEEDDGRNDTEEEPRDLRGFLAGQESHTILSEPKQVASALSNEAEDVVTDRGTQDEEANDVLGKHATNDSAPVDTGTAAAGAPESEQNDENAEEADGTVLASVFSSFLGGESANEDNSDGTSSSGDSAQLRRYQVVDDKGSVLPHPLDRVRDVTAGDVEEDEAERDGEPQEEGHDPILVIAVKNQRRHPPASEEAKDEEMNQVTAVAVDGSPAATSPSRVGDGLTSIGGRDSVSALLMVAIVGRAVDIGLFSRNSIVRAVRSRDGIGVRVVPVAVIVHVALGRDMGRIRGGARGVNDIITRLGRRRVVLVHVRVLVSRIQGRIRIATHELVLDLLVGVVVRRLGLCGVGGGGGVSHCEEVQ